jgi:NADPH2:quinone reductase
MQAIAITQPGPADVLRPVTRPDPTAGEGEVVIRVQASGVNRPDVMQRLGFYPPPPGASDLPGLEVAGVIESGDEAALRAAGLAVGDAVCALLAGGGYAERAVAPVAQCLPVPRGWSASRRPACRKHFSRCGPTSSCVRAWRPARRCWCKAAAAASV